MAPFSDLRDTKRDTKQSADDELKKAGPVRPLPSYPGLVRPLTVHFLLERGSGEPVYFLVLVTLVTLVIVIVTRFQGPECVLEDPLGDTFSELASVEIGGASMNPLVDASFDNVERGVGEPGIRP